MQPRSESSTSESSVDPGYNPKYSVRLSLTTSSVFPNYHSPDSLKPSPQEKTSPSHSRLFLFLAKPSLLRNLYLVLAFSFLAAFDGLLIGLEDSSENIWKILTVIASHKLIITFCLSLELLQATSSNIGFGLFLLIFSLVSPLGVGVGLAVSAEPTEDHQVIVAVLQGLAGGTIVYLVMFELVQRERGKKVAGLLQLLGIFSGFMLMLVLELYSNHSEMERTVDLQVGADHLSLDKEVATEIFDAMKTDILEMDVM